MRPEAPEIDLPSPSQAPPRPLTCFKTNLLVPNSGPPSHCWLTAGHDGPCQFGKAWREVDEVLTTIPSPPPFELLVGSWPFSVELIASADAPSPDPLSPNLEEQINTCLNWLSENRRDEPQRLQNVCMWVSEAEDLVRAKARAPRETHPSRIRPLDDNVLLYLKPRPTRMAGSLLTLPQNRSGRITGAREAIVLATGPGWRLRGGRGPLVPTEVEPGQCVVVDAKAGQDWALDVAKPRTNPRGCAWESFPVPTVHERVGGEYRMVRADEILFELPDQRPEDEALELDYGEGGRR